MTKTILIVAIAGVLAMAVGLFLGSNRTPDVGGVYNITEQVFEAGIDITGAGALEVDGTDVISSTGQFVGQQSTSRFGVANTAHVIYLGAGDGCAAVYATASGTLTTAGTSTSNCN